MDTIEYLVSTFAREISKNPKFEPRLEEVIPYSYNRKFNELGPELKRLRKTTSPKTIDLSSTNIGLIWDYYTEKDSYSGQRVALFEALGSANLGTIPKHPAISIKGYLDLSNEITPEAPSESKKINEIEQSFEQHKKNIRYEELNGLLQMLGVSYEDATGISCEELNKVLGRPNVEEQPRNLNADKLIEPICYQPLKIMLFGAFSEEDLSVNYEQDYIMSILSSTISDGPIKEALIANYPPESSFGPYKILQEFLTKFENKGFYCCHIEITAILFTTMHDISGAVKIQEVKHILQWDTELTQLKLEELPERLLGYPAEIYCTPIIGTARPVENEDLMKKELQAIIDAHNNASISKQLNEPKAESPFVQEKSSSM